MIARRSLFRLLAASSSSFGERYARAMPTCIRAASNFGIPAAPPAVTHTKDSHTAKWMQADDLKAPIELVWEEPPIEVTKSIAACDGGHPELGHPVEYIAVFPGREAICKYCGLRYTSKGHHHH